MTLLRRAASDRRFAPLVGLVFLACLLFYGSGSGYRAAKATQFLIFALVYLSLVVLTGMSGVISLLSATFLGFGAFAVAAVLTQTGIPFLVAVVIAGAVTAAVCVAIGLPVLRLPMAAFIVMTLGFAALVEEVVFTSEWCCGGGTRAVASPRSEFLASDTRYMVFCALVLVAFYAFTAAWRASRIGRALLATRDNPKAAEVLGVNVTKAKLAAFAVSGFLAGVAGGLFAGMLNSVDNQGGSFSIDRGIEFFGFAMLGGISSLAGPIIAASLRVLTQVVLDESAWAAHSGLVLLAIAGPGTVAVQAFAPDGIAGVVGRWLRSEARERPTHTPNHAPNPRSGQPDLHQSTGLADQNGSGVVERSGVERGAAWDNWPGGARLRCRDVTCNFGGVVALDDVSITVEPGEIVGLLGTNGAGKSTLINAISGLVPMSSGRILFDVPASSHDPGHERRGYEGKVNLVDLLPYERARVGVGRTFQDVAMFPTMSCIDNLLVATHVSQRRGLVANGLLLPSATRESNEARATVDAVLDLVDLRPFADATPAELSYGTLRMLELAAMLVLKPRLLLLDEPASGIAEAEARALGPLLRRIRDETGVTMLLVEHDVALVRAIADRIVGMDAGRVLTSGTPDEVLSNPEMITAYLGADPAEVVAL